MDRIEILGLGPLGCRKAAPGMIEIYSQADERNWRAALPGLGGEAGERITRIAAALPRGPYSRAVAPSLTETALDQLECRFPNFAEPIDAIRTACALCTPESGMRFAPLLLDGPPGVGKTAFARALGRLLLAPPVFLSMASATAGFSLAGLDMRWSTGSPGLIFRALVMADALLPANRLIVLDELDKASGEMRSSPVGPLYTLLEPSTAKQFKDEAVDLPIDASPLLWLATSNRVEDIPEALRSRMQVARVSMPRPNQMAAVVGSAWADLRLEESWWGERFSGELAEEVVQRTCGLASVRDLRNVLRRAAGEAAREGRTEIRITDIDQAVGPVSVARARIGFV